MTARLLKSQIRKLLRIPIGDTPRKYFFNDGQFDNPKSEMSQFFSSVENGLIKWSHYPDIYAQIFEPFRDKPNLKILEIGTRYGGGIELLQKIFPNNPTIFGIDIIPQCSSFEGQNVKIRIGDQSDETFLKSVGNEMGGIDIVIDDGSHNSRHQRASFEALFPFLNPNGIYVVEDVEHSYFRNQKGWPMLPYTFVNFAKRTVESLNSNFRGYKKTLMLKGIDQNLYSITFFRSVIVFRKKQLPEPKVIRVGRQYFPTRNSSLN